MKSLFIRRSRMESPSVSARTGMPNLDFLRSLAVILVAASHTFMAMHMRWIGTLDTGWFGIVGVLIFFVHTSLVLMWSLERNPHFIDFYIRRFYRIYPLAIAAILITVLLRLPTMQNTNGDTFFAAPGFSILLSNMLLVQNVWGNQYILGVLWTLPLEVDMYLVLPFLSFFLSKRFWVLPIFLLWTAIALFDLRFVSPESSRFLVCIPYFLSGVIAYILSAKIRPLLPSFLFPPLVAILVCAFMSRPSWRLGWAFSLSLGVAIPLFRQIQSKWLIRASHEVAKYSYGIYLAHAWCIALGINLLRGQNLAIRIAAIVLSLTLTVIVLYHFVEKPMIDLGARIVARRERRRTLAAASKASNSARRGNIAYPIIFAMVFWAILTVVWNFAARRLYIGPLSAAQRARLDNLGDLPKYREANAALQPDANRVVFFGDSITHRWDLATFFPNSDYLNRGIDGQTSSDMLVRFREDVLDLQPKAVVILAGVNDFGEHNMNGDENDYHKLANLEANYQTMAELAELHKVRPVFISILPLHAYTPIAQRIYPAVTPAMIIAANKWLQAYCATHNYQFIDAYSAVVDQRGMLTKDFSEDGVHPNAAGYQAMARAFSATFHDK